MDKELFNDGINVLDAELRRVKCQQNQWKMGHHIDKRKLYLNLNAASLTLNFMVKKAKEEFEKENK